MGWERRRGKFYYYRKIWQDGHVISVYCGGGERGMKAAREDQQKRLAQQEEAVTQSTTPNSPELLNMSGRELIELIWKKSQKLKSEN